MLHVKESLKNCMRWVRRMDAPSDVILQLVSIAEYSSIDWRSSVNIIDNLGDGRGYTIGLVGFCTGTGDFLELLYYLRDLNPVHVLLTFLPVIERIMKSSDTGSVVGLEKLPAVMRRIGKNDKLFMKATWYILKKLYWKPALDFCDEYGLKSELSRYIVYDTIVNFGNLDVFRKYMVKGEDEGLFLRKFLDVKQKTIEDDESLGDTDNNRVDMQKKLLRRENFGLDRPMSVYCYTEKFYIP